MKITILGAGIAGLCTAIALKKAGYEYIIYEAAEKIGPVGAGLGLGANAIKAFKELGIDEEVINAGRVLEAFTIYDETGKIITKTDSIEISKKYGIDNFTIHRHALHNVLLKHAGEENVVCNKKCTGFSEDKSRIKLFFSDGTQVSADFLIVADGLHSAVRKKLLPVSQPRYAGYTCWRSVVSSKGLEINEAMEFWGRDGRFGIVPLANDEIYWFMCVNSSQNNFLFKNFKTKDLINHFNAYPKLVTDVLKRTDDSKIIWGDICDIQPIDQFSFNNIVLIGDAAHATTPNLGQGACQAIEDAVVLGKILENEKNLTVAFGKFQQNRVKRTHYIVNKSWQIGKVAQMENWLAVKFRNLVLRLLPASFNEKQFQFLYDVKFK